MSAIEKAIEAQALERFAKLGEASRSLAAYSRTAAAMCSEANAAAMRYYTGERRNGASASEALERATQLYVAKLRQVAAWVGLQGAGNGP